MNLEQRIIDYLRSNPGKKAREIADALGEDKSTVNSLLYRMRGRLLEQVSGYRWKVLQPGGAHRTPLAQSAASNTPLARLARYYLACLAKDLDRNVSEFAASKYGAPKYAELAALPFAETGDDALWEADGVRRVLGKIRHERRKLSLVLGYPTRLAFVRAKTGWEGFFVEPLLVFELDIYGGGAPSLQDERPEINVLNPQVLVRPVWPRASR